MEIEFADAQDHWVEVIGTPKPGLHTKTRKKSGGKLASRDQQGKVLAELFRQVSDATDKNAIK